MKLQLKTAQAAKKAGYKQDGGFIMRRCRYSSKDNPRYDIYTTQSDAKTWLRQVKNLHLSSEFIVDSKGQKVWQFTVYNLITMQPIHVNIADASYEVSLETTLLEAFNNLKEWTYKMKK